MNSKEIIKNLSSLLKDEVVLLVKGYNFKQFNKKEKSSLNFLADDLCKKIYECLDNFNLATHQSEITDTSAIKSVEEADLLRKEILFDLETIKNNWKHTFLALNKIFEFLFTNLKLNEDDTKVVSSKKIDVLFSELWNKEEPRKSIPVVLETTNNDITLQDLEVNVLTKPVADEALSETNKNLKKLSSSKSDNSSVSIETDGTNILKKAIHPKEIIKNLSSLLKNEIILLVKGYDFKQFNKKEKSPLNFLVDDLCEKIYKCLDNFNLAAHQDEITAASDIKSTEEANLLRKEILTDLENIKNDWKHTFLALNKIFEFLFTNLKLNEDDTKVVSSKKIDVAFSELWNKEEPQKSTPVVLKTINTDIPLQDLEGNVLTKPVGNEALSETNKNLEELFSSKSDDSSVSIETSDTNILKKTIHSKEIIKNLSSLLKDEIIFLVKGYDFKQFNKKEKSPLNFLVDDLCEKIYKCLDNFNLAAHQNEIIDTSDIKSTEEANLLRKEILTDLENIKNDWKHTFLALNKIFEFLFTNLEFNEDDTKVVSSKKIDVAFPKLWDIEELQKSTPVVLKTINTDVPLQDLEVNVLTKPVVDEALSETNKNLEELSFPKPDNSSVSIETADMDILKRVIRSNEEIQTPSAVHDESVYKPTIIKNLTIIHNAPSASLPSAPQESLPSSQETVEKKLLTKKEQKKINKENRKKKGHAPFKYWIWPFSILILAVIGLGLGVFFLFFN